MPASRSVGITRHGNGFGFRIVRLRRVGTRSRAAAFFRGVPVRTTEASAELTSLTRLPHRGPAGGDDRAVPERSLHRPLHLGLQIQNFDDHQRRSGESPVLAIGSVGCFVRAANGAASLISNNHCIAAENRGVRGRDRILQPGNSVYDRTQHVATLTDYVELILSSPDARPHLGNVIFNSVDAGLAELLDEVAFRQEYVRMRTLPGLNGIASVGLGSRVFKVGCATGLTVGIVTDFDTVVGPVVYDAGNCWFERSIVVESVEDTPFADHGDSGSAVLDFAGNVVGLLYASDGVQNYVCPIDEVLRSLNCTLIRRSAG